MKRGNLVRSNEALLDTGRSHGRGHIKGGSQVCAGVAFVIALACIAQDGRPAAQNSTPAAAVSLATTSAKPTKQQKAATADNQRRKQISDESTQLLAMAVALKAEVDKTNKDVLSLNVIRKADEIERMARTVKEKMKLSSGPG